MSFARPLVVVSCAHVGQRGAVSECGRIVEEEYSAKVAHATVEALLRFSIDATLLRSPLGEKAKRVDAINADCAIEPHLNALRKQDVEDEDHDGDKLEYIADQRGRGHMVLYDKSDPAELSLALNVAASLTHDLPGRRAWGPQPVPGPMVARQRLTFLQDTRTPAVLPELLFLTNAAEVEWLLRPESPSILGIALARGINSWLLSRYRGALRG